MAPRSRPLTVQTATFRIAVRVGDGAARAAGGELDSPSLRTVGGGPRGRRTGPDVGALAAPGERRDLSGVDPGQADAVARAVIGDAAPAVAVAHQEREAYQDDGGHRFCILPRDWHLGASCAVSTLCLEAIICWLRAAVPGSWRPAPSQ